MFRLFTLRTPYFQMDGGGGGGSAPASNVGGGSPSPAPGSSPSIVEIPSSDALIKYPGAKDPVKFAEYRPQGYIPQSEWTKKTQELSREKAEFERQKAEATRQLVEYARQLATARNGGQQGGEADLLAQVRNAPYIDGQTAAQLVETIQTKGIAPVVQAIQQRDQALKLLFNQLKQQEAALKQLTERSNSSMVSERVKSVRDELGLPEDPEANEFLLDLLAAYEGDDMDTAFPEIARKRVEGLRRIFRELDKRAAQTARSSLIPGKGGAATPGRPLSQGYKSPQQLATELGAALGIPE